VALALAPFLAACEPAGPGQRTPTASAVVTATPGESRAGRFRYVALGDSYTIGTSVGVDERFPNQLAAALPELELVDNLGVNGFTSRDLIEVELPRLAALRPDVVTVLIGVNDVFQGVPNDVYCRYVYAIPDGLVAAVGNDRVLVVTIPDYTVTPAGADYGDPTRQSAGIRANNETMRAAAAARSIAVVDIYGLSLGAKDDRGLVAADGLHPSGAQYAAWTERILPVLRPMLGLPDAE
jgi:lysophospholipase L1-like esterase